MIDVIQSQHGSPIISFDIAEISKDIVSYSEFVTPDFKEQIKCLVVHGLQDQSYLNGIDEKVTREMGARLKTINSFQSPTRQHLKWVEYWRCDPKLLVFSSFVNSVSLTPQGDAMCIAGNKFLSVWTRDSNMSTHSYSLHLYYA